MRGGAAGAGGGGILSALMGGLFSLAGTGLQSWSQSEEAEKQRDWQEYMASTAYQRTMKDMRKAGLNPILAYSQGSTGAGPGAAATSMPNMLEGLGASAQEAMRLEEELKVMDTQSYKNYRDAQKAGEEEKRLAQETKNLKLVNKVLDAEATDAQFKKRFYYGSESGGAGEWMKRFRMIMDSMHGGRSQ